MTMALIATVRGTSIVLRWNWASGDKDKGDADIRQDFPEAGLAMKTMLLRKKAVLHIKMNILTLLLNCSMEKTNEAVHFGKMTHYIPENNVYVYFRYILIKNGYDYNEHSKENQTIIPPVLRKT
jgi:hypothetical protein